MTVLGASTPDRPSLPLDGRPSPFAGGRPDYYSFTRVTASRFVRMRGSWRTGGMGGITRLGGAFPQGGRVPLMGGIAAGVLLAVGRGEASQTGLKFAGGRLVTP